MMILIERDSATKIPKEVAMLAEAQAFVGAGFNVTVETENGHVPLALVSDVVDGKPVLLDATQPPQDDAFVEIGAERFSDGKKQTAKSLSKAVEAWKAAHPEA